MKRMIGGLCSLAALVGTMLAAQTWSGDQAVALQVNDSKGKPVPTARVVFTFQGIPGETGPDIVGTDGRGRAVVAGLAPGPWQVEVTHPDYLSFIAMIDIRRGKKPLMSASFLEAGGRSLAPVKVKFSKGDRQQPSPILEARQPVEPPAPATAIAEVPEHPAPEVAEQTRVEPSPPPAQVAPPESTVPEATTKQEIPIEQPEVEVEPSDSVTPVATPVPDPATEVEPAAAAVGATVAATSTADDHPITTEETPTPAPEPGPVETPPTTVEIAPTTVETPPTSPPVEVEHQVEPEAIAIVLPPSTDSIPEAKSAELIPPATEEISDVPAAIPDAPEIPTAAEVIPEPVEQPAPKPPPPPAPVAAAAALPPPPDPGSRVTSHSDGTCSECGSAEWTLQVSVAVPAMDPGSEGQCDAATLAAARAAMVGLSTSIQLELDSFIGPVANGTPQEAIRRAEADLAAPFQSELASFVSGTSPCQIVGLVLPRGLRFSRVRYAASDQREAGDCSPGQPCTIGDAQWLGSARVERGPSATIVYGLFENSSTERGRRAILTAYYRPPNANWRPRLPAVE